MEQWLPRGTTVKKGTRIKRMIASSHGWQIYSTNHDTYALVAATSLYRKWCANYISPKEIFDQLPGRSKLWIYCSSSHYIVSSLEQGPYPNNNGQIEAFSIAFGETLKQICKMLYTSKNIH